MSDGLRLGLAMTLLGGTGIGLLVIEVTYRTLNFLLWDRTGSTWGGSVRGLVASLRVPLLMAAILGGARGAVAIDSTDLDSGGAVAKVLNVGLVVAGCWIGALIALRLLEFVLYLPRVRFGNPAHARLVRSQLRTVVDLLPIVLWFGVIVYALSAVKGLSPVVTVVVQVGFVTAVIATVTNSSTLGNFTAGIVIGFGGLVVEGDVVETAAEEYGRVTRRSLTHVRIELGPDRTLVVPLSRFFASGYRTWARSGALKWDNRPAVTVKWTMKLPKDKLDDAWLAVAQQAKYAPQLAVVNFSDKDKEVEVRISVTADPRNLDAARDTIRQLIFDKVLGGTSAFKYVNPPAAAHVDAASKPAAGTNPVVSSVSIAIVPSVPDNSVAPSGDRYELALDDGGPIVSTGPLRLNDDVDEDEKGKQPVKQS